MSEESALQLELQRLPSRLRMPLVPASTLSNWLHLAQAISLAHVSMIGVFLLLLSKLMEQGLTPLFALSLT